MKKITCEIACELRKFRTTDKNGEEIEKEYYQLVILRNGYKLAVKSTYKDDWRNVKSLISYINNTGTEVR